MVISRATSPRQLCAELAISMAVPAVSEARNVMIATTVTNARPAIDASGTSATSRRKLMPTSSATRTMLLRSEWVSVIPSLVNVQAAIAKNQPAGRIELVHQGQIMGGDDHRGA